MLEEGRREWLAKRLVISGTDQLLKLANWRHAQPTAQPLLSCHGQYTDYKPYHSDVSAFEDNLSLVLKTAFDTTFSAIKLSSVSRESRNTTLVRVRTLAKHGTLANLDCSIRHVALDRRKRQRSMALTFATGCAMSVAADQQFQYSPLEPYQIRLLKLQPSDDPQKLCYTLHHVGLHDAPAYSAISYRWGDPLATTSIYIDGHQLPITNNLWHCLHQFMQRAWPKFLWVDAVCINQADIVERGEQVGFMHEIYSQPKEVIAWLGHEPSECTLAFERMAPLAEALVDRQGLSPWQRPTPWDDESVVTQMEFGKAFRVLTGNQYWQRAWIVQEFLAPKEVLLSYREHMVSWRVLSSVFDIMKARATSNEPRGPEYSDDGYLNGAAARLCEDRAELACSGYEQPEDNFYGLLLRYRYAKCSDARDKIFSLIGLDRQGVGQRSFSADYTLPVHELMVHALAYIQLSSSTHPGLTCCHLLQSTLGADASTQDFRDFYHALLEDDEWTRSKFVSILLDPDGPSRAEAIWDTGLMFTSIYKVSDKTGIQGLLDECEKRSYLRDCAKPLTEFLAPVQSIIGKLSARINDCSTPFNLAWAEDANPSEYMERLPDNSRPASSRLSRLEPRAFVSANGNVGLACPAARAEDLVCIVSTPADRFTNDMFGKFIMLVLRSLSPGVFSIIGNAMFLSDYMIGAKLGLHDQGRDVKMEFQKVKVVMDPLSAFTLSTPLDIPFREEQSEGVTRVVTMPYV